MIVFKSLGGGTDGPTIVVIDLRRDACDRAIIGDPHNDENLIVSQLQLARPAVDRARPLAGEQLRAKREPKWTA